MDYNVLLFAITSEIQLTLQYYNMYGYTGSDQVKKTIDLFFTNNGIGVIHSKSLTESVV